MILISLQPWIAHRTLLHNDTPLERYFIEACFSVSNASWREEGRRLCDALLEEKERWEEAAQFVLQKSYEKRCYGEW